VIFAINTDGTNFEVIHNFGPFAEGIRPVGSLLLIDGVLVGSTLGGGDAEVGLGTLFSIRTSGSDFNVLHTFRGQEGGRSLGGLAQLGGRLYGTTNRGGPINGGTIFSLNVDGTDFTVLHEMTGGLNDGAASAAPLTAVGSNLYGTALNGGELDRGGIFSIDATGSDFTWLYSFKEGEGRSGEGLLHAGGRLFGTTGSGGSHTDGSVFGIDLDGSHFSLVHSFSGLDGIQPNAELISDGIRLYGTTSFGSAPPGAGVAYSFLLDGTDFNILHDFAGAPAEGDGLWGPMLLSGSTLYGTTINGGTEDAGTVFAISVPEPHSFYLASAGLIGLFIGGRKRHFAASQRPFKKGVGSHGTICTAPLVAYDSHA
jgi:uncharacterized repeat protein (TIGR03803 family)